MAGHDGVLAARAQFNAYGAGARNDVVRCSATTV